MTTRISFRSRRHHVVTTGGGGWRMVVGGRGWWFREKGAGRFFYPRKERDRYEFTTTEGVVLDRRGKRVDRYICTDRIRVSWDGLFANV